MFQISVERLAPLLPPERIFIVTGQDQVAALRADAPHIPPENFVAEPFGMNTGPAVGLGVIHIQQRAPDALVAVLTADQHIADKARLRQVLAAAAELATRGEIITLGITPSFASTGYGYIRRGAPLAQAGGFQAYQADGFTEKPDLPTALRFRRVRAPAAGYARAAARHSKRHWPYGLRGCAGREVAADAAHLH